MLESVRCPGCTAHYGLRPERVHDAIRRARCFRCGDVFNIEAAVARLLTPPAAEGETPLLTPPVGAMPFEAMDLPAFDLGTPTDQPEPEAIDLIPDAGVPASEIVSLDAVDMPGIDLEPPSDHPAPVEMEPIAEGDVPAEASTPEVTTLDPMDMPAFEVEPILDAPAPEGGAHLGLHPQGEDALEALPTLDTELPLDLDALLEVPEVGEGPDRAEVLANPAPGGLSEEVPPGAQTLSLRDLEDADEEILNKTLVVEAPPVEAAPGTETASGFSSAKDAISRILGGLDAPAGAASPLSNRSQRPMDMDAAMSALDDTLGHAQASAPASPAQPQAATGATVRLNAADLQAAMSGLSAPPPSTPIAPPPTPRPFAAPAAPAQDQTLLRIQVGTDVYDNLSVERLTEWIMEGRVLEHFMVARQNSENWIEAVKVPSLRPAFDRLRRMRGEPSDTVPQPPPPPEMGGPAKKGLFGFLRS